MRSHMVPCRKCGNGHLRYTTHPRVLVCTRCSHKVRTAGEPRRKSQQGEEKL